MVEPVYTPTNPEVKRNQKLGVYTVIETTVKAIHEESKVNRMKKYSVTISWVYDEGGIRVYNGHREIISVRDFTQDRPKAHLIKRIRKGREKEQK